MRYTPLIFLGLFFCGCASMPPTAKLIDQVTKNENAIEEVEESDLPEPVKARVTKAITETQKLAVEASAAWEQCQKDLAAADVRKWQWMAIGIGIGAISAFFVTRGIYRR